ncbi:MAG: SPOR domain-containing protein [Candidatus Omnitrophica bacterium]|nr:SPOR domain-containing protein [Candidatus Omnitrophota bacterium]
MDFRHTSTQLELFSEGEHGPAPRGGACKRSFKISIKRHEKQIMLLICFIVCGVVFFSFGFERGRRLAGSGGIAGAGNTRMKAIAAPKAVQKGAEIQRPAEKSGGEVLLAKGGSARIQGSAPGASEYYTIQIASYTKQEHAKSAAQRFEKKGYKTIVMPKGKYVVLCIGNFPSKDKAQVSLKELKKEKQYSDSFVRRL